MNLYTERHCLDRYTRRWRRMYCAEVDGIENENISMVL